MPEVLSRDGLPIVSDFASGKGTPIVVDTDTGTGYVLISNIVKTLNAYISQDKLEIVQTAAGVPQIRLTGFEEGYAELRCGGSGSDDGDLFLYQTGDTVWMQSYTTGHRLSLQLVPSTSTVTTAPANLELYGTNALVDGTNYERFRFHSKGTSEDANEITAESGGTGNDNSIHIFIGGIANGLWIGADANNGFGTKTPSRKCDVFDGSGNPQFRISYSDSVYAELKTESDGQLSLTSQIHTVRIVNGTNPQNMRVYGTTTGDKYVEVAHTGTDGVINTSSGRLVLASSSDSLDYSSVGRFKTQNGGMGVMFLTESSADQSAPDSNQAVLYTKDNGAGKTQLCVRFNSGAVQVIATEP